MRLDKLLANSGCGSRKEVKKIIQKGRVRVNGNTVKDPGFSVSEEKDEVTVGDNAVTYKKYRYYLMNKPAGVVSATEDLYEKTVLDLVDEKDRKGLFPVGRLDKDTTGLLLLTNDGALSHRLLSPKHHVKKKYLATLADEVTEDDIKAFAEGLVVDDEFTALPAELEILPDGDGLMAYVTITEGKFHQVKRMFKAVGNEVTALKRLSMGDLILPDDLAEGEYKEISITDVFQEENKKGIL